MYHFIINPNSRSGKGAQIWNDLETILKQQKIKYQAHFTQHKGHGAVIASELSANASSASPVTLIAVGGDGTIQEILSGVPNLSAVIFGYIPTGSGNDFCRSIQLPQNPQKALQQLLACQAPVTMDVPFISYGSDSSRFAISCGIGFDAAVCHEVSISPAKKLFNRIHMGKLVYLFIALKQLLFQKPKSMTLIVDNHKKLVFPKVYFTAVMNQKYEGGGFKFCPDADYSDKLLDVIVVDSICKLKILLCLPTAFFGKHTNIQGIHIFQCRCIDVHSSVTLPIHIDGEATSHMDTISVSLEPAQIKMLL